MKIFKLNADDADDDDAKKAQTKSQTLVRLSRFFLLFIPSIRKPVFNAQNKWAEEITDLIKTPCTK